MTTASMPLSRKLQALGASFVPSRGAVGSTFALSDGKTHAFYSRTPWGTLRVRPEVGQSLMFRQQIIKRHQQFVCLMLLVILLVVLL